MLPRLVGVCLAFALAVLSAEDLPLQFRVRTTSFPYDEGAIFAMPGEKVAMAIAPAPTAGKFNLKTPGGPALTPKPNTWTWEAPLKTGRYPLEIEDASGKKVVDFSAFVMVPASEVHSGLLNGFTIGAYPDKPLNGNSIYLPPRGFVEVTKSIESTKVSPHFRIGQFLTKQKSGYPKYLVLDERLVYTLEAIGRALEPLGWDADDIFVMSGYRTPFYNAQLDDTKYSLHQWGKAADIFLDKNGDGAMDDFNGDKTIDRRDAIALAGAIETLAKGALKGYVGGIGIYGATSAHGPFVHVDTRPWSARW